MAHHQQQSLSECLEQAVEGNPEAQYWIGDRYYRGIDVPQDKHEAMRWWKRAANGGSAKAKHRLGLCCYFGWGVEDDADKNQGRRLWKQAFPGLISEAVHGDAESKFRLAVSYRNGWGVRQDAGLAARWFERAADQGHAEAQFHHGYCFRNGVGVKKDSSKAVKCFLKAARQNQSEAQYELAVCFQQGFGVDKSLVQAAEWYHRAAENEYPYAQMKLYPLVERITTKRNQLLVHAHASLKKESGDLGLWGRGVTSLVLSSRDAGVSPLYATLTALAPAIFAQQRPVSHPLKQSKSKRPKRFSREWIRMKVGLVL